MMGGTLDSSHEVSGANLGIIAFLHDVMSLSDIGLTREFIHVGVGWMGVVEITDVGG